MVPLESMGKQSEMGKIALTSRPYIDSSSLAIATDTIDKV
jgi:hypothetical protein